MSDKKHICDGCRVREPFEHRCHKTNIYEFGDFTGADCECECNIIVTPLTDDEIKEAKLILLGFGALIELSSTLRVPYNISYKRSNKMHTVRFGNHQAFSNPVLSDAMRQCCEYYARAEKIIGKEDTDAI